MACQCTMLATPAQHLRAPSASVRKPLRVCSQAAPLTGTGVPNLRAHHRLQSCPSTAASFAARSGKSRSRHRRQGQVQAYSSDPAIQDRLVSAGPYLIPLCDGLRYGKFFFAQFPQASVLLAPLSPIISVYFALPFASIAVFFGVYLGIINNQRFSPWCKFNAMQAILLDIILILPGLFENIIKPPMSGPGLQIYISIYNSIWLFIFASFIYGVGSVLTGGTPRIPLVADAAEQQIQGR